MSVCGRSLACGAFAILFLGTSGLSVNARASEFPAGSYEIGPYTVVFRDGGTYEVSQPGGAAVRGTYTVAGDVAAFTDLEGDFACPQESVGKYTWKVEAEKLIMTAVDDKCEGRSRAFARPLTRKSAK